MANHLFDALAAGMSGRDAVFLHRSDAAPLGHDEFLDLSARFAKAIRAAGLVPGDRLAAQVSKSAEALAVYVACLRAGVVFLPLNPAYTPEEVAYFVGDSGARLLLCDQTGKAALEPVAARTGAALTTLNGDGSGAFADAAREFGTDFGTVSRGPDDLAALLYTSGTTGRSKGAMLTHQNLLSNARTLADVWRFTDRDVLLHALPIFHTHGLFVASNTCMLAGAAMIFLPKFDAGAMIARMPEATTMMGVPTFYTRLLDDPRFTAGATGHMRLFMSGSAPLLAETHQRFEERTGHRILERYGMTETNMNTSNPYDGERRAGTVGFPLPGVELKITDPETGAHVAQGEIGVIEVRGPNVFKGYWGMPEKTREELRDDGFFITGDLGLIDADGYVQIVGRNKDLIITGGFNVYPKEVELMLDAQPGVLESAVIGVPHPDFGEGVLGVLVAEKSAVPDTGEILEEISSRLARYKQPKRLVVIDELPRNTMGKVQKNLLRDRFANTFSDRKP